MKLFIVIIAIIIIYVLWCVLDKNHEYMINATNEIFTPLILKSINDIMLSYQLIYGSNNKTYLLYELYLTNFGNSNGTVNTLNVYDDRKHLISSFNDLNDRMANVSNTSIVSNTIAPNETKIIFIELELDRNRTPFNITHSIEGLGSTTPGNSVAQPIKYDMTPLKIHDVQLFFVDNPLRGKYSMINACCISKTHRRTLLPINNNSYISQRFALDIIGMNHNGEYFHSDPKILTNWFCYGNNVYSMTDGIVIDTNDGLDDHLPGSLPDASKYRSTKDVLGNSVVIKTKHNTYILYAHLIKNSVTPKKGDTIKSGQRIGKLGNTGNTSAPHLHIHMCSSKDIFGSNGVAFGFKKFVLYGQYDLTRFDKANSIIDLTGNNLLLNTINPVVHFNQTPMQGDVVIF